MDNNIEVLIVKSFNHYDEQITKNRENIEYIKNEYLEFRDDTLQDSDDTLLYKKSSKKQHEIFIKGALYTFQELGFFDVETKTWIWSWCIPKISKLLIEESKFLLKYGLALDIKNEDTYYLKFLLINSRIYFEDEIQLNILISICSYLLGNRIRFIYQRDITRKNNENVLIFYLII